MIINFVKNNLLLFLLLFSTGMFCQSSQTKEIDELLEKAKKSNRRFKNLDELKYAKQASLIAEEINDSKRITESYYYVARSLAFLELPKQSFLYIEKAGKQPYYKKNVLIQAQLREVKAINYYALGLQSQYDKEIPGIISLLKGQTDVGSIILRQRTYINIGIGKPDSAFYYSDLAVKDLKKIPEKNIHLELSDFYRYMGIKHLDKRPDSSLYYFNKSFQIDHKYHDPVLFFDYTQFGDYFAGQKQYRRAIDYYKKALENIKEQSISPYHFVNDDLYKKIAELYGKLGEKDKQHQYETIYADAEKKALAERNKNMDYAINVILNDEQNKYNAYQKKIFIRIAIGILGLLTVFFIIFKFLRKNIKNKEHIFEEVNNTLQHTEEIISQKNIETKELQLKVNEAYHEVIELAKKNDPAFYFRFQEVYPEFQEKIIKVSPGLRTSELILCAYTFLGFNIKEVAEYTFKSVHTIRNRKQNLRKKFAIPTEQDMGIWLRNLIEGKSEVK